MTDIHYLVFSVVLAWLMIMVAGLLHTPTWTRRGATDAFGNRESLPEKSPLAARADRAAKNMNENLPLFIGLFLAARLAGANAMPGAALFFFARLAYWPIYLTGIKYVRTLAWFGSLAGLLWLGLAALHVV
ncbi:MAG TPA: MAPEG family protein [Kofleriaceae bacterium]|jgi:uncharacterized MAPEG superfamily protein